MVTEVKLDIEDQGLDLDEHLGVVTGLTRKLLVRNLTETNPKIMLQALAAAGVPVRGATLDGFPSNLVVVDRKVRLIEKKTVEVTLIYQSGLFGQNLGGPAFGLMQVEISAALNQVTTHQDRNGVAVVVSHTFPGDDPKFPNQTQSKGMEFSYEEPQLALRATGYKFTQFPHLLAFATVGRVNVAPWFGAPAREWMCMSCRYSPLSPDSQSSYNMEFEFQRKLRTWDSTLIFIDDRTGEPPPNLVQGIGKKTIEMHESVNFEAVIGVRFAGG